MICRVMLATIVVAIVPGLMSPQSTRGPEVERLSALVGTFEGDVRYAPPGMPAQVGRMTYRGEWDLDGWIIRSRYDQVFGTKPSVGGLLIFRWRPKDSTYAFEGYANTPMEPHRLSGRWDDGLVFDGKAGGATYRERWQRRGADTLVNTMEFQRNGEWIKVSEAVLLRKRDP